MIPGRGELGRGEDPVMSGTPEQSVLCTALSGDVIAAPSWSSALYRGQRDDSCAQGGREAATEVLDLESRWRRL